MKTRLKADLALLLAAIVWGMAFVAQRSAALLQGGFAFNGLRFLLGALVLLPFSGLRWRSGWKEFRLAVLAGMLLFIASAFQQYGVHYTTAGNAGFLTSLYVVLVPVLLVLGWRERPGWISWVAVVLAVAGAFLLSTGGRFEVRVGDGLELSGAVFWALHVIVVGRYASRIDSLTFAASQFGVCALLNLIVSLLAEQAGPGDLFAMRWAILYTGIFSIGLGFTLQVMAQKHTPSTDAALIMSLESVVAVISGWLLLGEELRPIQILGCGFILMGVLMTQLGTGALVAGKEHE
ncbi:MAG: DMT family transporter [Anaerolineales bacterium]|nr:DMT family transporter [Anaerolineales bacterium]